MSARRDERGQITVMTVGFLVVLGLLVVVVVNASGAYLERQRLASVADGAALAAADGLRVEAFYETGAVELDHAAARRMAAEYVAATGARVGVLDVSFDGDIVTVRLERAISFAIAPPGWSAGTTVVAEASAELRPSQ